MFNLTCVYVKHHRHMVKYHVTFPADPQSWHYHHEIQFMHNTYQYYDNISNFDTYNNYVKSLFTFLCKHHYVKVIANIITLKLILRCRAWMTKPGILPCGYGIYNKYLSCFSKLYGKISHLNLSRHFFMKFTFASIRARCVKSEMIIKLNNLAHKLLQCFMLLR